MQVADLIGADPKEIIFTSGATESNNLAIKGVSNFYRDRKKHIVTTQTERMSLARLSDLSAAPDCSMHGCSAIDVWDAPDRVSDQNFHNTMR